MRWRRASLGTLAIALGVSGFRSLCQGVPASREQRHFSAEDEGVEPFDDSGRGHGDSAE